jgi:hypothetical protein
LDVNSNIRNKKAFFSLSLILLLATTLLMAFAQPSLAQVGIAQPEKTTGYISVAPTLIGVGQEATVNVWAFPLPTTYNNAAYWRGFFGVTVTFVKPDGTKDAFMPVDGTGGYIAGQMTSLGSMYFFYKPDLAGNWSVSFTMPAQNITDQSGTVQYLGCTSNTAYFTVQTEPVLAGLLNGYPWAQLPNPNVYWSYPINSNNREWSQIASDWTGISSTMAMVQSTTALRWQPYGSGPNTGHIVWKQQVKEGGIIGGDYGSLSYVGNSASYAAIISFPVVMDGMVFTNILNTAAVNTASGASNTPGVNNAPGQFRCTDLATGKVLYQVNGSITGGIHLPGTTYQQASAAQGDAQVLLESSYGSYVQPYVFGAFNVGGATYWNYYDPLTGNLVRQLSNATNARLIDGTVLAFGAGTVTGQTGSYIYRWNMTSVANNNWPTGITWKVPQPTTYTGGYPSLLAVGMESDVVVVGTRQQWWGYSATTGTKLWNISLPYPVTSNEVIPLINVDDFIVFDAVAATYKIYSIKTGALLCETDSFSDSPWATTWTVYYGETNDLNNLYITFPDGTMRAYSLKDGHEVWRSKAFASTEYANNAVPFVHGGLVLVDGKLYVYGGYSIGYMIDPIPRQAMIVCINATTGDIIYTLNGGVFPGAAANGYIIGSGIFDGNLYCLGKGPTSTTVTAQQQVGGSVLIQGSVLDTSPVSSSATLAAKFPNGVPAISDADMSVWMDYLHMQNATLLNNPPNCTGVPVTLTSVDPNGNSINIGTTTSNGGGHFAYQWNPATAGLYTIYATFAGTDSYFSSYAVTSATVASAASPTAAPTSATQPLASNSDMIMYFAATGIAIIIAIAVVGALILRKK